MHFKNRYTQIFAALTVGLILMMGVRFFLLLSYPQDFSELTISELLISLFIGMRVDIITLFTFLGLFVILLALPFSWVHARHYRHTIAILWNIVLIAILAISIGDVLYYDFSHRHVSNELFYMSEDTNIITDMAFNSYLYYTISATLLFLAVFGFTPNSLPPPFAIRPYPSEAGWSCSSSYSFFLLVFATLLGENLLVSPMHMRSTKPVQGHWLLMVFSLFTALQMFIRGVNVIN